MNIFNKGYLNHLDKWLDFQLKLTESCENAIKFILSTGAKDINIIQAKLLEQEINIKQISLENIKSDKYSLINGLEQKELLHAYVNKLNEALVILQARHDKEENIDNITKVKIEKLLLIEDAREEAIKYVKSNIEDIGNIINHIVEREEITLHHPIHKNDPDPMAPSAFPGIYNRTYIASLYSLLNTIIILYQ